MGSKAIAFLGLLLAVVLLITSEVTARELIESTSISMENTEVAEETNGVEEAKYPVGEYGPGGGYGGFPGGRYEPVGGYGGYPCGRSFGGNRDGSYGNRGSHYGGGYFPYRCCSRDYYEGCYRCCSYLGEAMDKEIKAQPHN